MAYRLAAQISRDRRLADAEEAEFIAEAERLRARRDRQEREQREQREQREHRQHQQEIIIRVDDSSRSRSPYERSRRPEVGRYEPRRRDDRNQERYTLVPESTLREIRLREEEEAYQREREIARDVVREELRAQLAVGPPPPRRREPRPLLDLTTGIDLRRRSEEIPRPREVIYNHVENPRLRGERRRPREAVYEEVVYDDELVTYEDQLIEEARIRREADEYARYMRQRREMEDELWP